MIPPFQPPTFNVYFFSLCAVAHVLRLFRGSISPFLSTLLFLLEYGLMSNFIKVDEEQNQSWIGVAERYRGDVMKLVESFMSSPSSPSSPSLSSPPPLPRGILDSCSDSDDSDDSDIDMSLEELEQMLKKQK